MIKTKPKQLTKKNGRAVAVRTKAAKAAAAVKPSRNLHGVAKKAAAAAVASNLGATQTLPDFLATAGALTKKQRQQIVEQALVMLDQVYAHLPLKRAMHAIEPLQRLKLLRQRLGLLSERAFHDELIATYTH